MKMNRFTIYGCTVVLMTCTPSPSLASGSYEAELEVPNRERASVELIARPDLLQISFVVEATESDFAKATTALQTSVTELSRKLKDASNGLGTVRLYGMSTGVRSERKENSTVKIDGVVEVPLGNEQDFWARARTATAFEKVLAEAVAKGGAKTKTNVNYSPPQATLKDPESKRAELTALWLKRIRELAQAAQSKQAPLHIVDCKPPPKVSINPISLEEVGLSLQLECRLDVIR